LPIPDLAGRRLANQQLVQPRFTDAASLVRWFGAVQAQDYRGALWALGLRLPGATEAHVARAIEARAIVRTWPMRGTLHFVPAEDARWMLRLLAPRMVARAKGRHRQLDLDARAFARSRRILERALERHGRLTREEAYAALHEGGVAPTGQRGIHVIGYHAQQGLICLGPHAGRQPTFVLLEDWIRRSHAPDREEALATLAVRYFTSHGPATLQDFAWWSGLPVKDAREAIAAAGSRLGREARDGRTWWTGGAPPVGKWRRPMAALLPPWDEYLVAYKERAFALGHIRGRQAQLQYAIAKALAVADGRVCGTWSRTVRKAAVTVTPLFWSPVTAAERAALTRAAAAYAAFLAPG
jgi:winged helix DNA-binding protein